MGWLKNKLAKTGGSTRKPSETQAGFTQRKINAYNERISERKKAGRGYRNLSKDLAELRVEKQFHEAKTPAQFEALKKMPEVAALGKIKDKPKPPSKPVEVITGPPMVDIHKLLDNMNNDLDQARSDLEGVKTTADIAKELSSNLDHIRRDIRDKKRKTRVSRKEIRELRDSIEDTKKSIDTAERKAKLAPGQRDILNEDYNIVNLSEQFYKAGNFPSSADTQKVFDKYGQAALFHGKPKTVGEALNRLAYGVSEVLIGGIEDATIYTVRVPTVAPSGRSLRLLGALITPSAADMAAGYIWTKLALTKKGRKLLQKLAKPDKPSPLTIEEMKYFEKIVGESGFSTDDLRNLPKGHLKTIQKLADYYEKNPAQYTAGASQIPSEVLLYDDLMTQLNWDTDNFIDFLATYGDDLNLDPSILVPFLGRINTGEGTRIIGDLEEYAEKNLPDLRGALAEKEIKKIMPDVQKKPAPPPVKDRPISIPDLVRDTKPREIIEVIPKLSTEQIKELVPLLEEAYTPKEVEEIKKNLPVIFGDETEGVLKERKKKKGAEPSDQFKVRLQYSGGPSVTKTVKAQSFRGALIAGQRGQRTKEIPIEIEVTRLGRR